MTRMASLEIATISKHFPSISTSINSGVCYCLVFPIMCLLIKPAHTSYGILLEFPPIFTMETYSVGVIFADDGGGTVLYNAPYQLCVLPEFIASMASGTEDCLLQLREELSRLKFMEKNNDLYQFRQVYTLQCIGIPYCACLVQMYQVNIYTLGYIQ